MVGIYFSGTGNSRCAVELFCNEYDEATKSFSIEDDNAIEAVKIKMPDSIGDEKVLKRPLEKNKELVKKAEQKISKSVQLLKLGKPT